MPLQEKIGENNMKMSYVIGRTVIKGQEVEYKEPLPYYLESQKDTLIESAKRRIRIRYHSEYGKNKGRLSYSVVHTDIPLKSENIEKKEKKSIISVVKSKVAKMTKKETRVKYSELSNDLKKYVRESSHYTVDNDDYIHDEWNSENITAEDIEDQKTYDETGEL